jgi:hypothetical protein
MKKFVLAIVGLTALFAFVRRRHQRVHARSDMFEWWSPDV